MTDKNPFSLNVREWWEIRDPALQERELASHMKSVRVFRKGVGFLYTSEFISRQEAREAALEYRRLFKGTGRLEIRRLYELRSRAVLEEETA